MIKNIYITLLLFLSITFINQSYANTQLNQQLINAIHANNLQKTKELLKAGANPNSRNLKNPNNPTPLMIAVYYKNYNLVKTLIKKGANINAVSHDKITALLVARLNKFYKIQAYLKRHGAK